METPESICAPRRRRRAVLLLCVGALIGLTAFAPAQPESAVNTGATAWKLEDLEKYESVEVTATGYSPGKESTGKEPGHPQYGITFSGVAARRNERALSTIAADLRLFPLGTVLYIPGYGFGIVADTGSAIKGYKIDLFYDTKEDVYRHWGKKKVKVYVIRRGDGHVTEEMMRAWSETFKS
jgi:3D (Asp-Asp-Asp) domain-containing protein